MFLELVPSSGNGEGSLVGEGVQRDKAIHMNPIVLAQADPVRLQLAHGLVADLLRRLGLSLSLGLEVKQNYLPCDLEQAIKRACKRHNTFVTAHTMLRANDVIQLLPESRRCQS